MLFRLLVLALGEDKGSELHTAYEVCLMWKKIQNVTKQARPKFMGMIKSSLWYKLHLISAGQAARFCQSTSWENTSHSRTAWNCCSQIHLGDRTVTRLLLGTPSSWWWNGWNEAISDWRPPSILIVGWDHRTTEYPALEGTQKGHWSPTYGPAKDF